MKTLIGVVTWTKLDKNEERIAWISPLVDVTGSRWEEVVDATQEFPARGILFWPRATTAVKGALIHFRAKENSFPKEGGDDYMVVDPLPAFEAVDLRGFGTCEQVRVALSGGIPIPGLPNSRMLVWCKDNLVVGPVALVTGAGGLTSLEKGNRARISCFQFKEGDIRRIEYEGVERSVVAKQTLGPPHSYVDWDDDEHAIKRAIQYAVTKSSRGSIDFPKQLIEEATENLTKNGSTADLRLELYRLERSRSLAAVAKTVTSISEEIVASLLRHPSVIKEIAQLKVSERDKARSETEAALGTERQELALLKEKRSATESALSVAKKSLDETEALVREQTRDIEAKIQKRIVEVLREAPSLLADVALLKPFLGTGATSEVPVEVSVAPWRVGANKISNAKELRARIIPAFKGASVPSTAYQPIHAALASGLLPVVGGSRALEALRAYAHVVTGGRIIVVQATSALADVQDIFGRVAERRFVPHAAGLIDIVRAARKSTGCYLVVLDGINRGATESYLLPLLAAALGRRGAISLFHPSAVERGDPYFSEARMEWPKTLLLAATVIEGPTTLPVAPDIWADGVLIQTDLSEAVVASPSGLAGDAFEIDPSNSLLCAEPCFEDSDWIHELFPSLQHVTGRFEGGLRTVVSDPKTRYENITKCAVVPFLASIADEDARDTRTKAAEKAVGSSLQDLVATARRRVS